MKLLKIDNHYINVDNIQMAIIKELKKDEYDIILHLQNGFTKELRKVLTNYSQAEDVLGGIFSFDGIKDIYDIILEVTQ